MSTDEVRQLLREAEASADDKNKLAQAEHAIAQFHDTRELTALLSGSYEYVDGILYRRLLALVGETSLELLLAYVLWNNHYGYDDHARHYFQLAKKLAPDNEKVLMMEMWLLWSEFLANLAGTANHFRTKYQDNEWVTSFVGKISECGRDIMLGPLDLKW
jgi:hypothetical protein